MSTGPLAAALPRHARCGPARHGFRASLNPGAAQNGGFGAPAGARPAGGLRRAAAARRAVPRAAAADDGDAAPSLGSVPPGSTGSGGGGGSGGGDDGGGGSGAGLPAAAALGAKALAALPADLAAAAAAGRLPAEILERFTEMARSPLLAWLLTFPGFRERLLADPGFMFKVGIELGIGICTKTTAEYAKRGEDFSSQLDFVAANIMMALIADFMLVWLPAPTYSAAGKAAAAAPSALGRLFAGCPDNAFQRVQPGAAPFTAAQRAGAVVRNGAKLFGVGCAASLLGVGVTNALVAARALLDPAFVPLNDAQDVLSMSAAYGAYMATSSNLRYQVLAGVIEERGIEVWFRSSPATCAALSLVVRTANTFLGSLLWVDFIRLLGFQKAASGH